MYFTSQEEARLKELIVEIETRTGVQVLAAVVGKADSYPEVPWKAFALASSASALLLTVQAFLDPPWIMPFHAVVFAVTVLGIGAASALLATLLPWFARWFVTSARLEAEVQQYARAVFTERRMFDTRERTGILLLVSLFERRVVVLPDSGVASRVDEQALAGVVARMTSHLARGARYDAMAAGLAGLKSLLLAAGFSGRPGAPDEIRDEFVQEKGLTE